MAQNRICTKWQFWCQLDLYIEDRRPPDDPMLSELPFFPSRKHPAIFSNPPDFDGMIFTNVLYNSYDFRRELFSYLTPTELSHTVQATGLKLTQKEKDKFLSPIRIMSEKYPVIDRFLRSGWGITLYGRGLRSMLKHILNPVAGLNRRDSTLQPYSATCHVLFTQPDQHDPAFGTLLSIYRIVPRLGSITWSCSRLAMTMRLNVCGSSVRASFEHRDPDRITLSCGDLSTSTFSPYERKLYYMNVHHFPLKIRTAEASRQWGLPELTTGDKGIHGKKLFITKCPFKTFFSHPQLYRQGYLNVYPEKQRYWVVEIATQPCCDDMVDRDSYILGEAMVELLGEKVAVEGCACQCHGG
jgi:hypothetical protein